MIRYLSENITACFNKILNSNLNSEEKFIELFKSQLIYSYYYKA